jgi:MOSC domain-containing protein YiiM
MELVSVNVGAIQSQRNARGALAPTGLHKQPTVEPVLVEVQGLANDASAYRSRERGDTAVHLYAVESYAALNTRLDRPLPIPCFGENLTAAGYPESEARIGDVIKVGSVLLQVNQPVVRCSWPTTLAAEPRLTKWATQAGLTGIYLNVLEPGTLQQGDEIFVESQGNAKFTVAYVNQVLNHSLRQGSAMRLEAAELLKLPQLAERWKANLRKAL